MSDVPCPCCDMERLQMTPIVALALGCALGATQLEQHRVTELMCDVHRTRWVMAMCKAAMVANLTAEEEAGNAGA